MKLQEHKHIGKRNNNEDNFGYTNYICIVCVVVGLHAKSEVANNHIVREV